MEEREFIARSEAILRRFLARVPEKYVTGIESAMDGGEYGYALEDVVHWAVDDRVPISPEDRAELALLAGEVTQGHELVPLLERAVIEPERRPGP